MKTSKLIIVSAFSILTFSLNLLGQSKHEWNSFRANPELTAYTDAQIGNNLKLDWEFKTEDPIKSSPVIHNHQIFIGSNDGFIYALSMVGELQWKYNTGTSIEAAPMIFENTVYVGNLEGKLYALDVKSGKLKWEYTTDGQISGSAIWIKAPNKKDYWILCGSYDCFLHCVDQHGKLVWKYESENYINGSPATNGLMAIFGGCDGYLHMIDVSNGNSLGQLEAGSYIASSPALKNQLAFYGNYDGNFYGVDLTQKKNIWTYNAGPFIGSPALAKGKVVIGSQDKYVYCFDQKSGKVLWKFRTLRKVDSSPVIANDKVIIGSDDGRIYVLDLMSGQKIWSYEIGRPIFGAPAVIEDKIVVGALDGRVYCFSTSK